ncbi:unnamed protein product [Schistosoma turkestanicum]|nr:unnamed protein product [Schistosoma turkestanicum]
MHWEVLTFQLVVILLHINCIVSQSEKTNSETKSSEMKLPNGQPVRRTRSPTVNRPRPRRARFLHLARPLHIYSSGFVADYSNVRE